MRKKKTFRQKLFSSKYRKLILKKIKKKLQRIEKTQMHNYYININYDEKIANVINNDSKLEIESKN